MTVPAVLALAILVAGAVLILATRALRVKLRAASGRGRGVRVYDVGADLHMPPNLHSRGYQFALYLTLKSLPRESATASEVTASTR